jgi:hypothetical protein
MVQDDRGNHRNDTDNQQNIDHLLFVSRAGPVPAPLVMTPVVAPSPTCCGIATASSGEAAGSSRLLSRQLHCPRPRRATRVCASESESTDYIT